jgi:hypothetical protein
MNVVYEINLIQPFFSTAYTVKSIFLCGVGISLILLLLSFFSFFNVMNKKINIGLLMFFFFGFILIPSYSALELIATERFRPYYDEPHEEVDGAVIVFRKQSKSGRGKGDLIQVGEEFFEINYSKSNPFYSLTISRGGYLKDGVLVKIHHVKNKIFKIELK